MRKRGVGDKSYATAHFPKGRECPTPPITNESSSSIWWAVLRGRGTCAWGGGGGNFYLGGGGNPRFPTPLYETLFIQRGEPCPLGNLVVPIWSFNSNVYEMYQKLSRHS